MSIDEEDQVMETEPAIDDVASALRTVLTTDPTILLDTFVTVFQLARDVIQRPKDKYYTVIVPDVGVLAVLVTVDSADAFLGVWRKAYSEHAAQIFGFHKGDLILPSEGGDCMVAPWGTFPLFIKASDTTGSLKGYLGPHPAVQQPESAPAAESPVSDDDEEDHGIDDGDVVDEDEDEEENEEDED